MCFLAELFFLIDILHEAAPSMYSLYYNKIYQFIFYFGIILILLFSMYPNFIDLNAKIKHIFVVTADRVKCKHCKELEYYIRF